MSDATNWDETVDVLVVGTGAGAMVAALTAHDKGASAMLIEKGSQYGGSSAMSGGGMWIPCNHLALEAGVDDNMEDAWTYMHNCVGKDVAEDRQRAYIETGPKLVKYLCDKTHVDFITLPEYPDYYPHIDGNKPGGRALDPKNFDARKLGNDEFLRMRKTPDQELIMGRVAMTIPEARVCLSHTPGWIFTILKLFLRYWLDVFWRFKSKRDRNLAMGNALVGMLRRSLMDRNIPLLLETPAKKLIVENGRVVGVEAERKGKTLRIRATKGVILGAGGFEANQAMREKYLPKPTKAEWSSANPWNTGDIINMGLDIGAAVDVMDDAWWGPAVCIPGEEQARFFVIELSLPGSMLVNKAGKRYVNEAAPYCDKVNAMYKQNTPEAETVPSYLIFDADFRNTYPIGPLLPGAQQPDKKAPAEVMSIMEKADSLEELAGKLGVDAEGLKASVARFNEFARTGKDLDFGRGDTAFDQYYGDLHVKPNPNLATVDTAPFYGIKTYPGELGTKGGLLVDKQARVVKEDGSVIDGLYAIGNCSAPVMGYTYPGAGSTLGPAATFGFIAAHDVVGAKIE